MKMIKDKNGIVRAALCFLALFLYHGMRDYLLTGICAVSTTNSESSTNANSDETPNPSHQPNLGEAKHPGYYYAKMVSNDSLPSGMAGNIQSRASDHYTLDHSDSWSALTIGLTLAFYHWGSAISMSVMLLIIYRREFRRGIRFQYIFLACWIWGCISALDAYFGGLNSYVFATWKFLGGVIQGILMPLTILILHLLMMKEFNLPFGGIYFATWLGTICGIGLGGIDNPLIAAYIFGGLCLLVTIPIFFMDKDCSMLEKDALQLLKDTDFAEIFSSAAVWVCLAIGASAIWTLYTFIFGLIITLHFRIQGELVVLKVSLAIAVGGLLNRFINAFFCFSLYEWERFSPVNRFRLFISCGSILTMLCLILCGTVGIDFEYVLLLFSATGIACGCSLLNLGVRVNIQYLSPAYPCPILLLATILNYIAGGVSILLFPLISKVDEKPTGDANKTLWTAAWLSPIVIIILSTLSYLFLVSTECLNHKKPRRLEMQNGDVTFQGDAIEMDAKSFKSIKSAQTFKSIASQSKGRTTTFGTVKDGFEADFGSVAETDGNGCWSIKQESDCEAVSIRSSNSSYNSIRGEREAGQAGKDFGVILSARNLDTTSAWLTSHHNLGPVGNIEAGESVIAGDNLPNSLYLDALW